MKKIVILTATRAEYGLLKPIIEKIDRDADFDMCLAVTGMHLCREFGMTINEIKNDEIKIDKKIEIVLSSDTPVSISKSMGLAIISFSEYFDECKPDALLVLGDRYETLAVCCAAMNARIPIIHLHGGETTEGLVDEAIRHSITKMSFLHFTSTEVYRQRVIQMGEDPSRVFNVGALGVENVLHTEYLTLEELEDSIGVKLGNQYAVGTFHPVTLEHATAEMQIKELIAALDRNPEINYLFTKANADTDGRIINEILADYALTHKNLIFVDSLGMKRYLSALKYACFIIGNSSSGIMEAPSFGIPTINIGDRQKGRIAGKTVIQCNSNKEAIDKAIKQALSKVFKDSIKGEINPYGDGNTSNKILYVIKENLIHKNVDIKKQFFDLS